MLKCHLSLNREKKEQEKDKEIHTVFCETKMPLKKKIKQLDKTNLILFLPETV